MALCTNTSTTCTGTIKAQDSSGLMSDHVREIVNTVNFSFIAGFLSLVGIVTNILNVITFFKIGFSDSVNISLFSMALSDLLMVTLTAWVSLCMNPLFRYSDIPFDSYDVHFATASWARVACLRLSGMATIYVALERCLCVVMPLKVKAILTPQKTTAVIIVSAVLSCASIFPLYGYYLLGPKFIPSRNRTVVGIVPHADTDKAFSIVTSIQSNWTYATLLTLCLLTAIMLRQLHKGSKWRQSTSASQTDKNKSDHQQWRKDAQVQKMVISICIVYIICFILQPISVILMHNVPGYHFGGRFDNLVRVFWSTKNNFETANVSVNFFIYIKLSSKFRTVFNKTFMRKNNNNIV